MVKRDNTVHLHEETMGSGPILMGISGFGCGRWLLEPLGRQLKSRFTVILPDNRGMGDSPKSPHPFTMEDMARDILRLVKRKTAGRIVVVGASMGGFVVQRLLLMAPEKISAAVILCSTSGGAEFGRLFHFWTRSQMEKVLKKDPEAYARWILEPPISPSLAHYPKAMAFMFHHRSSHREEESQVMLQFHAMEDFLQQPLPLEGIQTPVLVACGQQDPVFPPANSRLLAKKLASAQYIEFPDTDHLFFVEKAQAVATAIGHFVEKNVTNMGRE